MTRTLYIIGNGFDLHHGIPSRYSDFGRFLAGKDKEAYEFIERYFPVDDDFWTDFESGLAHFDAYTVMDDASDFIVPYGADDWKDANHHDYQFEIQQIVEAVSTRMKAAFVEWIRQLPIPSPAAVADRRLQIDPSATFLNFNYTTSLVRLYGVAPSNIVQIHGDSNCTPEELILGHGWGPSERKSLNDEIDQEAADTRVLEGNQIIDGYFEATFKPTAKVIERHQPFFASLASVTEIVTIGHSLGDVDLPYFRETISHIDIDKVTWKVCYHGSPLNMQQKMAKLGIDPIKIKFILANEL
jgi:hypothetical protein